MRRLNYKKIYSKIFQSIDLRTIEEREVFVSLILASDLHGRFHGEPEIVRGVCFPLVESMTISKVKTAMDSLAQSGMIKYYENSGKKYLMIVNHEEYNPTKDRGAGKSIFPIPDNFEELPNTPKLSKVIKSKSELLSSYDFESVYDRYPKKSAKAKCIAKMKASVKNDVDFANLNKALTNYIAMVEEDKAKGFDKRAWKDAQTFFNNWADFIDTETEIQRIERLKKEKNEKLEKEMTDKKAKFLTEHPEYKKEEEK
jgi:hypothetical protein